MTDETDLESFWPDIREAYEEILAGKSIGSVMGFSDPDCVVSVEIDMPSIVIRITMSDGSVDLSDKVAKDFERVYENSEWMITETGEQNV